VGLIRRRRRIRYAGGSSRARFRARRWQILRENWRDWVALVVIGIGSVGAIVFTNGITELFFAALFGGVLTIGLVGWLIGGDVYSLTWLWGSIGEQLTAEALDGLDGHWICEHDLPARRGNFDHVVVGPPGVFLLDTKRLSQRAIAGGDGLRAGRQYHLGAASRAAAAELGEQLERFCGRRPWVQGVVTIWGDFPQRQHEEHRVVYVHGDNVVEWLMRQPAKLSPEGVRAVGEAVRQLRSA
jgi:hypothetical protein